MRPVLLVLVVASGFAFGKPKDMCSKNCEDAMVRISAACRKNASNAKGKERAEEGRVCLDSISTMRSACLKQCAKSAAQEATKH